MPLISKPGRYSVKVASAEFGESQKGTPFLQLGFQTETGEHISGWLYLSEAAFNNSVKTLRDAFKFNGDFETAPTQLMGKPCSITVEEEEDDKHVARIRVKWINAPSTAKPLENKDSFLKQLTAKAARVPVEASKTAAPVKKVEADEPF